jgi:hypothetical protein
MRLSIAHKCAALSVSLAALVIACGGSTPDPVVNHIYIQTIETFNVNGAPISVPASVNIAAQILSELPGATGAIWLYPGIWTRASGNQTLNNARLPGLWKFWALTGGCIGQYYKHPVGPNNTLTELIEVHNNDEIHLLCVPTIIRSFDPNAQTFDANGNIVSLPCCNTDTLYGEQALHFNESIRSNNGQYRLVYQGDGSVAVWNSNVSQRWMSPGEGASVGQAIMQSDGNFVVYDAGGSPVWHTNTWGNPGAYIKMQDDGNLVIYSANGSALWSSGGGGGGRWKDDGQGGCYWDPNDSGPDQCVPPTGRWKDDGQGGCYWDPNDSGPDQCVPQESALMPVFAGGSLHVAQLVHSPSRVAARPDERAEFVTRTGTRTRFAHRAVLREIPLGRRATQHWAA